MMRTHPSSGHIKSSCKISPLQLHATKLYCAVDKFARHDCLNHITRQFQFQSRSLQVHPQAKILTCATATMEAIGQKTRSSTCSDMKIVIAGAGIGGLVLAVSLLKKGFQVHILEKDVTAIRGEGKYRGPIQIQSNALAALEAIDSDVAEEILEAGCITGDRINGLCDGVSGDWYVKFDTFHPAVDKGLPVTRVISRVLLQEILSRAVLRLGGQHVIQGNTVVKGFEEYYDAAKGRDQVSAILSDDSRVTGDLLIGADGIWSKVRTQLIGVTQPNYSEYTCYTGISDFTPADIDVVGYRVFLGNGQYFVSSDVGNGKMQWYGFHKEPAGGSDPPGTLKMRLLEIFGHWCDDVTDLIKATPEDDVLRRDIYDRPPIFTWARGRVALLGDSAHAMQPNLGQGGCMAIEDAFELGNGLAAAIQEAGGDASKVDIDAATRRYTLQRVGRASAIHGMAGMAAFAASTYKAYLGEGLGPLEGMTALRIPHPGRVSGQLVLRLTMPLVLDWVLGGNCEQLEKERYGSCRIADKPRGFKESMFSTFMVDDEEIIRTARANWMLTSELPCEVGYATLDLDPNEDPTCYSRLKGVYMGAEGVTVGSDHEQCGLVVQGAKVSPVHARLWKTESAVAHVMDLGSLTGTFVNGKRIPPNVRHPLRPSDKVEFGQHPAEEVYKVKLQHVSLRTDALRGDAFTHLIVGRPERAALEEQIPQMLGQTATLAAV